MRRFRHADLSNLLALLGLNIGIRFFSTKSEQHVQGLYFQMQMEMETQTPWSWRVGRSAHHSIPWKGDMRKYRSGINELIQVVALPDGTLI